MGRAALEELQNTLKYFISIHALRGEGDFTQTASPAHQKISIHALRGEGDGERRKKKRTQYRFQSTPSVGRATVKESVAGFGELISIHALRGEGDNVRGLTG